MDTRPDQILYIVRVPMRVTLESGRESATWRDVIRCDRHRPTGLPHHRLQLPADTDRVCEICEHDE